MSATIKLPAGTKVTIYDSAHEPDASGQTFVLDRNSKLEVESESVEVLAEKLSAAHLLAFNDNLESVEGGVTVGYYGRGKYMETPLKKEPKEPKAKETEKVKEAKEYKPNDPETEKKEIEKDYRPNPATFGGLGIGETITDTMPPDPLTYVAPFAPDPKKK